MKIRLPKYIYLRPNDSLARQIASAPDNTACEIAADRLAFISPAGLVWLASCIAWLREQRRCSVRITQPSADMRRFMERMNLGASMEAPRLSGRFRHKGSRFVEVARFGPSSNTDDLARSLAASACPTEPTDVQRTLRYCLSEAMENVRQHANSDGFVSSMYYPKKGVTLIAIADYGIGLARSLRDNAALAQEVVGDLSAARVAIRRDTTGHAHPRGPYDAMGNTGNGLYYLDQICRLCGRWMLLWSKGGCGIQDHGEWTYRNRPQMPGVLLVMEFMPKAMLNYGDLMAQIRRAYAGDRGPTVRFG